MSKRFLPMQNMVPPNRAQSGFLPRALRDGRARRSHRPGEEELEHQSSRRVLVLEGDYVLATKIVNLLEDSGYEVAGPVRSVIEAKRVVGVEGVDGAILDADLKTENSLPLAGEIAR